MPQLLQRKQHHETEFEEALRKGQPELFLDEVDGLLPRRGGNSAVDNRIALGRAIRDEAEAQIRAEDLERTLKNIPPSANPKLLAKFQRFAEQAGSK